MWCECDSYPKTEANLDIAIMIDLPKGLMMLAPASPILSSALVCASDFGRGHTHSHARNLLTRYLVVTLDDS